MLLAQPNANIRALPVNTTVQFMYHGKQRIGPIEGVKGTCVLVNTHEGYRSFHPEKMYSVKVLSV